MLKVKLGPKMVEFAKAINVTTDDALEFVNNSINDPDPKYLEYWPTPESRRKAMIDYMTWVIDYEKELTSSHGINERIKCSLKTVVLSAEATP